MYSKWQEINKIKGIEGNGNRIFIVRFSHQSPQLLSDFISSPVVCAFLQPYRWAVGDLRGDGGNAVLGLAGKHDPPPPPSPKALNLFNYYHNVAIYTQAFNLHKGNNSYAGGCGSHFITWRSLNYLFLYQCHRASIASFHPHSWHSTATAELCTSGPFKECLPHQWWTDGALTLPPHWEAFTQRSVGLCQMLT